MTSTSSSNTVGPILFAYDGSELAAHAIEKASQVLSLDRAVLVLTVWQPADVGFDPVNGHNFDADKAQEVEQAAKETAAYGASLAGTARFTATPITVEDSPNWKGIITAAEEHGASLIVIGSHKHSGLVGHLAGSVCSAVVAHATTPLFVVHAKS